MLPLLLGFALSAIASFLVIRFAHTNVRLWSDHDMSGPQKFHARPVPRIGGVGIFLGLASALLSAWASSREGSILGLTLLACAAPAFLAGLAEDLTKSQSPRRRLFFTAV